MNDVPWQDDACSLVDAFRGVTGRRRRRSQATLDAIAASDLNAFSFLDPERALAARGLGRHLQAVRWRAGGRSRSSIRSRAGPTPAHRWCSTTASRTVTTTVVKRFIDDGGAVPVGLTTASEFGGLNVSVTKLNGVTHNPWRHGRTVGGSSAGSAAAVAGGLVSIATGGDGGGSLRIPAGYTGMVGMKGTFGRLSRGPHAMSRPHTVVLGTIARSVRDVARHYDVTAGPGSP